MVKISNRPLVLVFCGIGEGLLYFMTFSYIWRSYQLKSVLNGSYCYYMRYMEGALLDAILL